MKNLEKIYTDIDMIEKYLTNTASNKDTKHLNQRLDDERELRMLFDDMEAIMAGIELSAGKSTIDEKIKILDKTIGDFEESSDNNIETGNKTISIPWHQHKIIRAVAAGFVLLLVSIFVFLPLNTKTDEQLFEEYFVAHANNGGVRGEVGQMSDARQAFRAYDLGEYNTAIVLLLKVIPDSDEDIVNRFYLGNAYLAIGAGEEASILFKELRERNEGFALDAKWYLALSYLKMGESKGARTELEEIVEMDSDYRKEAEEILRKMEK